MSWMGRWRAMAREQRRTVLHRARAEAELDEELRFHLEMEAEKLVRTQGLSPDEARRRAGAVFGGVQRFKEEVREARGLDWLVGMRLDFVLALRMLRKHPGLTIVGGLGLAVGIAVAVGFFAAIATYAHPDLPLDEGDRIVALVNRDLDWNELDRRLLHDYSHWRQQLRTVQELGAFRTVTRNLIPDDGAPEPVQAAEITATGFTVPRVPPLLGRYLLPADERPDAPPVLVIGHDVWKHRYGGDSGVVGREVRLDGVRHTIVGVMPEGFGWPRSHQMWVPLRFAPTAFGPRQGPQLYVFGRLAPGVSRAEAQAELDAIGQRSAALYPDTHARLRTRVMPYVHGLLYDMEGGTGVMLTAMQFVGSILLVVIALNVALLVYARTAMRQGEMAVRTALGASRTRIIAQLFVEALMLSLGAAVVGLGLAHVGMRMMIHVQTMDDGRAFWVKSTLPTSAVLFAVLVAVATAVIVGVLPALQATGKRLQADLRQLGGGTGIRLGRTWTALIVAQVGIAVAALPSAAGLVWQDAAGVVTHPIYPIDEFLRAGVDAGEPPPGAAVPDSQRFAARLSALLRRVEEEPTVAAVTYWAWMPGRTGHRLEVEGIPMPPNSPSGHSAASVGVAPNYLEAHDGRILAGRDLEASDAAPTATAVVVNEAFVTQVLGGQQALGRRMRYVPYPGDGDAEAQPGPWLQIVGVASDLEVNTLEPGAVSPEVYSAVAPGVILGATLEVRVRPGVEPADFAPRLRTLAVAVDPALRLGTTYTLSEKAREETKLLRLMAAAAAVVLLSVFLLSAAGVYALTSLTVTRRRREIGIRTALGAPARHVLLDVLGRVGRQIGIGFAVGLGGAAVMDRLSGGTLMGEYAGVLLPVFGVAMAIVALLGASGPARRGLRIQPTEALRADA